MIDPKPDDPKPDVSFLKQLRDALFYETNLEKRQQLRESADNLRTHIGAFAVAQTFDNLTALNGAWARAMRVWYTRTPLADPPTGGHLPVPEQERIAA